MNEADTFAAIATPPGQGGVAIVRVTGPRAWAIGKALTGKEMEPRVAQFAHFKSAGGALLDNGLVLPFKAPHSYTGEDVVEFHCHGGRIAPQRVLEACYAAGARPARRGEFTYAAFMSGKISYEQAQGVLDLINARTVRAADAALATMAGYSSVKLQVLYAALVELAARVEFTLDVDENALPEGFWAKLGRDCEKCAERCAEDVAFLRRRRILREGALVVLVGPPNAGKSSLMNALLGEARAIVSDAPGTTRDTIEEGLDVDGWPIRLVDTAGLRETTDLVEAEGVRRTRDLAQKAEILLNLDPDPQGPCAPNEIRLHAKCDLGRGTGLNVSAKTGEGLDGLRRAMAEKLVSRMPVPDEFPPDETGQAQASLLAAQSAVLSARKHADAHDAVLAGNALREACGHIGGRIGRLYSSDMLDRLFSRFCVGK
ncbi:MAG TPA: tRNA uridine-5-carboxymethylaminomethyl(34) synthesis GTPase MnmE [Verrucomicrobia bacterium]|nr:tRNA uridine-5-carboxymethylaminomethyl(34) synthesis GTPase MnmE [Verrucomicrobiota bacterium]